VYNITSLGRFVSGASIGFVVKVQGINVLGFEGEGINPTFNVVFLVSVL
jgi:hypothetical protein